MSDILEGAGFKVAGTAHSAASALELMANTGANLFIIDVVMPGVSGIALAKTITEKRSDAAIIMTSSLSTESVVIDAISNGAMDFLKKPFSPQELIDSVEKLRDLIAADSP